MRSGGHLHVHLAVLCVLLFLPLKAVVVTREEAVIAGVTHNEPFIIAEFLVSKVYSKVLSHSRKVSGEDTVEVDDRGEVINTSVTSEKVHKLAIEFCQTRTNKCTNGEYYSVLDKIIELTSGLYTNRIRNVEEVSLNTLFNINDQHILNEEQQASMSSEGQLCNLKELHREPSAKEFHEYVKNSKPFIIRSEPGKANVI